MRPSGSTSDYPGPLPGTAGSRSEEREVFAHLPVADVLPVGQWALRDRRLAPAELRALHLQQVVHERRAEPFTVEAVLLESCDCVGQGCREQWVAGRIGVGLDRRRRVEPT